MATDEELLVAAIIRGIDAALNHIIAARLNQATPGIPNPAPVIETAPADTVAPPTEPSTNPEPDPAPDSNDSNAGPGPGHHRRIGWDASGRPVADS